MLHDPESKFFQMWGAKGWWNRDVRNEGCWGNGDLSSLLEPARCNRNWLEGAVGNKEARPYTDLSAPALLGYDRSIYKFCSEAIGWDVSTAVGDFNGALASRCLMARQNVLRVNLGTWNMCENLQWIVCAASGQLPSQGGSEMSFALAPKDLDTRDFADPSRTREYWQAPYDKTYAVSDVFFAEVCVLSRICVNTDQLFSLVIGEKFACEFDSGGYNALALMLRSSPNVVHGRS